MIAIMFVSDRFCGGNLNCQRGAMYSAPLFSDSFYIDTIFNANDNSPNENRGYSINYQQVPC